ncbi:MAG: UDP-N-acetylmuramate dehydrogenase [Nitriliruptoraceae bacterium]
MMAASLELAHDLRERGVAQVTCDVSLATLTTLRVGGPADVLAVAEHDRDLAVIGEVCRLRGLPWLVVGRGSNLLISDTGWRGVAIMLGRGYRGIEVAASLDTVTAHIGAAEPLPAAVTRLAEYGAAGFAWASAVPGTLGGAVRMNAGAHGGELGEHIVDVDLVRLDTGVRETWLGDALSFGYRRSGVPFDGVVVRAQLTFDRQHPDVVARQLTEIRQWRREHQPLRYPNCGSVFTNPPGDSAGRLIEAAGLKGLRVGRAQVSERHANFIVTSPGATAHDVAQLIATVQDRVAAQCGVELQTEVVMVGAAS